MGVDELESRRSGNEPRHRITFSSQETRYFSRIDLPSMDLFILS